IHPPWQGQVPRRHRSQGHRLLQADLQAEPPAHPVPGRWLRPDPARLRRLHPLRAGAAADEARAVPDARFDMSGAVQALSAEQVRWIARRARLELTEAELATMTAQLSEVLGYFTQLQQVNTEGVEPLAHALDLQNVFRADEPVPSLLVDQALSNAPKR